MITSRDIKQNIEHIYNTILSSDTPDLYMFGKLLKLSNYVLDSDTYVKNAIIYFLSINYHQILYYPNIKTSILKSAHLFWFHNKGEKITKLESCIYLLENFQCYENREIKMFIIRHKEDPVIGYKCKELIKQFNIQIEREDDFANEEIKVEEKKVYKIEEKINNKLKNSGDEKRKIYLNRRTIYDNTQNVHVTEINESMKQILSKLHKEYTTKLKSDKHRILNEMSMFIYSARKQDIVTHTIIKGSFERILSDTSTFTNLNLSMLDVALLVWIKIDNKNELKKRFIEELIDMNGMCATGHVTRLVNVLSGFFSEYTIKTSYKDQIKVYLNNHYNNLIEKHHDMDTLIDEITETDLDKKKNILKFINENGIRTKLFNEYKSHPEVTLELFNKWYDEAKNSYVGII